MAKKKTRKRRKLLILGGIFLVLLGLGVAAFLRQPDTTIAVQTQKVERRDLTETVVANGRIQPVQQVKISAEVSGEIITLPVKEGQLVRQGDLLVRIKPDTYEANVKSAEASFQSALAGVANSEANLRRAKLEFQRNQQLYEGKLISELDILAIKTSFEIARSQTEISRYQVEMAKAALDRVQEELAKTTIIAPLAGTISQLNSELGERVVGTALMSGTEIMTIADLDQMEARVDIGETDVVLVKPGQPARLEVDAFRDQEFQGTVTEIANSARTTPGGGGQEAVRFQVKIRIVDRAAFRPGMSVTAEIETRSRTNVLTVPIQSVTTRPPKPGKPTRPGGQDTNAVATADHGGSNQAPAGAASEPVVETDAQGSKDTKKTAKATKAAKAREVVFVVEGDHVRMVPVKRGISDADYTEIVAGVEEGMEVVSGGYRAISRELEEGKRIRRDPSSGMSTPNQPGGKQP